MKINPKVTGALAWTGLVVILAIPAANMLTGEPEARVNLTSDTQQVKTATAAAAAKPAVKPVLSSVEKPAAVVGATAATGDAVGDFVKSGRKMPSYISGNDAPAIDQASATPVSKPGTITVNPDGTIQRPALAVPAVTPAQPEVASVQPQLVAPVPLPASARPRPQTVTALPAPTEQPLVIDENTVASTGPVPPANVGPEPVITGDQLDEWDSGSLADYLERRGLMSEASQAAPVEGDYDADGFFLDEGPNYGGRRSRVIIY